MKMLLVVLLLLAATGCATTKTIRLPPPNHWVEGRNVFLFEEYTVIHYMDTKFRISEHEYRYHASDMWVVENPLARNKTLVRINSGTRDHSRELLERIRKVRGMVGM